MAKDVYTTDSSILEPLDWISYEPWSWIADYADEQEYGDLDRIYSVMTGDCPLE